MMIHMTAAFVAWGLIGETSAEPQPERRPDKTVAITAKEGKIAFVEKGKEKPASVTALVGSVLRWENHDTLSHSVVSEQEVDGKPLFDLGLIKPGEHKDFMFDIDFYRKAGGKTANVVVLKYHCKEKPADKGQIELLSPARR
jgi:plastocyanin